MTNTNVDVTNPSRIRAWWKNKNLRFDVAMSSIIMILNIEAVLYMKIHMIPFDIAGSEFLKHFFGYYIGFGLISCMCWVVAITEVSICEGAYVFGGITHAFGLGVLLDLLYHISPQLALFAGINIGIPCLLWFVVAIIGPCLCFVVQELRGWWTFVNQPAERGYPKSN